MLVADEGGAAVGWAVGWAVPEELHLMNVAVHPSHRRRGHARALLVALIQRHRWVCHAAGLWGGTDRILHRVVPVDHAVLCSRQERGVSEAHLHAPTTLNSPAAEVVLLEVRASNDPALRLYHSLGFERVGLRKQYYR